MLRAQVRKNQINRWCLWRCGSAGGRQRKSKPNWLSITLAVSVTEIGTDTFDPIGFVILRRDGAELHLTLVRGHSGGTHNGAHLTVDDATRLHDHLAERGVRIIKGLRDADYGLRGFAFADPDGNRIDVGQSLSSEQ